MQKMLIKHGDSLALVIDKPILELFFLVRWHWIGDLPVSVSGGAVQSIKLFHAAIRQSPNRAPGDAHGTGMPRGRDQHLV